MAAPGVGKLENYYNYLQNYLAQLLISIVLFQQILTTSEETGGFYLFFLFTNYIKESYNYYFKGCCKF